MHIKVNHLSFVIILASEDLGINMFLTQLPEDHSTSRLQCTEQGKQIAVFPAAASDLSHVYHVIASKSVAR